uniref:RCC1 domain-containing protein 1 isoform X1 n=1 Tax=Vespula vulgaris TaxID=7454 RepID=UPI00223B5431|nr:RCC1 domain-containing protein 1 isoform X1 [Vespula vulgaris]
MIFTDININMALYYAGFNASPLFTEEEDIVIALDRFTKVPFSGVTNMEISWNYFLLWRDLELYIVGKVDSDDDKKPPELLKIPESSGRCKIVGAGKESIIISTTNNEIWQYRLYEKSWKKVPNFINASKELEEEYPIKISQGGCTVILTNLGRIFNIPILVEMPKRIKFVDFSCGFDHTIMLAANGDVYSMGMGTRGQLGHGDLEDCDEPQLIEALAGLNVVQVSAAGWHNAVVTDQGDLYTWGWNVNGELGIPKGDTKVVAIPTVINFTNDKEECIDMNVKKVQCGNTFTICMMDDRSFWGCGSNKYGQLGQSRQKVTSSTIFFKLDVPLDRKNIIDFKCEEWGTMISTKVISSVS